MIDPNKLPNWLWLLFFLLLAVGLRALSFSFSVIDHDESTYAVIAQELLRGKTYYTDVWDTKPVGIFLIYAGILKTLGSSVLAIRFSAALAIGLTAYLLFAAARRWGHPPAAALVAGVVYPVMCSMHKWTFSANTELFFNLFTALGLFFFLGKPNTRNFLMAGLALGLGFIIKYFVLFDLMAFWLFYLLLLRRSDKEYGLGRMLELKVALGLGFVAPFAALFSWYYYCGPFEAFWHTTFVLPGQYANSFDPIKALNFFAGFQLVFLPFVLPFYNTLWKGRDRSLAAFGLLWTGLVWVIVILPGKFFLHYYFQLLVPLAFVLAGFPGSGTSWANTARKYRKTALPVLAIGLTGWILFLQYRSFVQKPDTRKAVAAYLLEHMQPDDILYCNHSNILYLMTRKSPPEKYIHPTLMTKEEHIAAVGMDVSAEKAKMLALQPDYLVLEEQINPLVQAYIDSTCVPVRVFDNRITVYQKKRGS
ncbi:MAG: hypothetical protein EP344_17800 [Bacteroidetes bacterium]|nr:MAG: hypothetical protein EP344_17800 [Bacteroidota bacterium]